MEMPSNSKVPWRLDRCRSPRPWRRPPGSCGRRPTARSRPRATARCRAPARRTPGGRRRCARRRATALTASGCAFSHCGRRGLGLLVAIQDGRHHLALAAQGEVEVRRAGGPMFGHSRAVALAGHGVDRRAAEIRAEHRVAAGQILDVEAHVHGMRLPGEEHDGLLVAHGALDLRQHALLARLDQLEVAEAELVLLDHLQHQPVAVVAGLDAVDRAVERGGEAVDVVEVLEARVIGVGRHREGVLGALEIGATTTTEPSAS